MRIPRIILIIISLVAIVCFFLPYVSPTDTGMELINQDKYNKPFDSVNMMGEDFANLSLFTYAKVYNEGGEEIFRSSSSGTFYVVFFCSVGVFALLVLLMTLAKRPTLALIFSMLMGLVSYLINWDFVDRRIMPNSSLKWGVGYYGLYICACVLVFCSIWLFVAKFKEKRRLHKADK